MTDREPIETTNLDGYGFPPLLWQRALERLQVGSFGRGGLFILGTVRPDGRPHAAGVGAAWSDGDFYFTSGPGTRKSRNLASNAAATLSTRLEGIDLVFEGQARRVTDRATLEKVVAIYAGDEWPAELTPEGDAFTAPFNAPSAGPPPAAVPVSLRDRDRRRDRRAVRGDSLALRELIGPLGRGFEAGRAFGPLSFARRPVRRAGTVRPMRRRGPARGR
jgi:pyridoxamine 5'-phosphate oxidase-like protein